MRGERARPPSADPHRAHAPPVSNAPPDDEAAEARARAVTTALVTAWMGERYYRTFRPAGDAASAFDALFAQRDRRIGVSCSLLWEGAGPPGASALEELLEDDLEGDEGGYVVWTPPGGELPAAEPRQSALRLSLARGLGGLEPGERREVRLPVTLPLAKVDAEGAYMSVSGPIASEWTTLSEGIDGAFHLDGRSLRRLPDERAELEIVLTQIRDRAALLAQGEVTAVEVHDYWLVSRLPADEPRGVTVFGAPPQFDAGDGAWVRRSLRAALRRALDQREAATAAGEAPDMTVLALGGSLAHIGEEMATAALRGMSPATYGGVDLVALVADGQVRQLLQPRSLPWADAQPPR